MAEIKFEVIERKENHMMIIRAIMKDPRRKMTLYLETDTGKVLYPITIEQEQIFPGITIVLDSDDMASCSLPPSIPETMIDSVTTYLGTVNEVIAAARKLIKEEQEKLKKGCDRNDDDRRS